MNEHISITLENPVLQILARQAAAAGMDTGHYLHAILRRHVIDSGHLPETEHREALLNDRILEVAIRKARDIHAAGGFDKDFILTVFRTLIADPAFRRLYEEIAGGDAYASGLPKKSSLNMYLSWHIKTAVGAVPLQDEAGRTRRARISNEPIQSYTLLQLA